jgi:hypothetical protein
MSKQHSSPTSLTILILCLCLGSLVILPMSDITGLSMTDISEIDFENYSQFDQAELDDDISIGTMVSATIDGLVYLKSRLWNLDVPTSCLSPEPPPPEQS